MVQTDFNGVLLKRIAKSCLDHVHNRWDGKTTVPIFNTTSQKCIVSDELVSSHVGFHSVHLVLTCAVDGMRKEKSQF
jgi:hypothetical protein